ncbi:MAG TPA: hypothetical protein DCF33_06165 [Saprospirales bacterium]|nr:hypothetical protein [Saprospirales bacterium]
MFEVFLWNVFPQISRRVVRNVFPADYADFPQITQIAQISRRFRRGVRLDVSRDNAAAGSMKNPRHPRHPRS